MKIKIKTKSNYQYFLTTKIKIELHYHSTRVLKVPKVNLLTSQPATRNKLIQSLIFFFSNIFASSIIANKLSQPRFTLGKILSE